MSRSRVYQCCTWFGEGGTSLDDELKSGRPKTSTNENTTRVDELIKCDRRMKIREIALKLEIPKSTVHEKFRDALKYRKVSSRYQQADTGRLKDRWRTKRARTATFVTERRAAITSSVASSSSVMKFRRFMTANFTSHLRQWEQR
ncbi:histone-lysine N-methyltransferase SETMAR [Elysia marginata]|uniref:Histone-lysine N-methyltransferase SETMAR n=1 Tax=Elysia marginata TaxID=1093978 RepID=A0AAV4HJC6_9GAST|nr:histone-lysine N-methyltransferase SETMAR [Elysia marginata]